MPSTHTENVDHCRHTVNLHGQSQPMGKNMGSMCPKFRTLYPAGTWEQRCWGGQGGAGGLFPQPAMSLHREIKPLPQMFLSPCTRREAPVCILYCRDFAFQIGRMRINNRLRDGHDSQTDSFPGVYSFPLNCLKPYPALLLLHNSDNGV